MSQSFSCSPKHLESHILQAGTNPGPEYKPRACCLPEKHCAQGPEAWEHGAQ